MSKIKVIIPAYNEEKLLHVIKEIPNQLVKLLLFLTTRLILLKWQQQRATVLSENRKGYGYACLKGMEYISNQEIKPDIVVLDGDYSDYPDELTQLISILEDNIDFVVGSRVAV
jgi:glycosyltransferase involved in cell wall biosynthesis